MHPAASGPASGPPWSAQIGSTRPIAGQFQVSGRKRPLERQPPPASRGISDAIESSLAPWRNEELQAPR